MYKHTPWRRTVPGSAPVPNWSRLGKKDSVHVRFPNGTAAAGTIDMIAADRSVFWVIRNDGAGRVMVYRGDDVAVTKVAPAQPALLRESVAA